MIDFASPFGRAVRQALENEYVIWLTTVDSNLMPQPRPVWFLWQEDAFLIFSQAHAQKVKHITNHPNVSLHFNTDARGDNRVIVFTGKAWIDSSSPPAHEVTMYIKKYGEGIASLEMTPEGFSQEYSTAIKIKPAQVRGWE